MFKQFIDREKELEWLKEEYRKDRSFVIIYGRRRTGKTELIKEFSKDKNCVYFLADQRPEQKNLEGLQGAMANFLEERIFEKIEFKEWDELFKEFMNRVEEKLIIVIDEFPYLIEQNKAIPSIFQKIWDENLKEKEVMLALLGSSVSMMETEVLGYKSPLYGRRTGQWKLKPFKFKVLKQVFPEYGFKERLRVFAFTDSIPGYLGKINSSKSPDWNLRNKVFKKGSYLYEEAENLLRQELRKPRNYFSILQAISEGYTRYGEICNRSGLSKSMVSQYLKNLIELHVVRKGFPITQNKESRNALYSLSDNYYEFWFRFLYPNKSLIEEDEQEVLMENTFEERRRHNSFVFEDVCKEAVWAAPFKFNKVGRWWYKDNEIDITALNEKENKILLGECKWSKSKVGTDLLKDLKRKSKKVRWKQDKREETYALFSKSGFTKELKRLSKEKKGLELYDLERLERVFLD